MQFKLVIYTSTKVIYMIVSEDELDSFYNQYSNSNIFILNIDQNKEIKYISKRYIFSFLCRCVDNEKMVKGENYMQMHKKKSFRLRQRFYFL